MNAFQPFINPTDSGIEWSAVNETHRLDHISGVVFEGSIALTAGAAAVAFTMDSGSAQTLAFIVTGLCVAPGVAVGWLLLWNPLRHQTRESQLSALRWKRNCVHAAVVGLLAVAPLLALIAMGELFFPHALARGAAWINRVIGFASAAIAVISVLLKLVQQARTKPLRQRN